MQMSNEDIVREYNQAKSPMKQIAILADMNACSRQEIVEILKEAGSKLPGQYEKKAEKAVVEPEPENPNSLDMREVMNEILEVSRENRKLKSIIIKMLEERYGQN